MLLNVDLETASTKILMAQDFFAVLGDVRDIFIRNPNLLSFSYGRYMGRLNHLKEQGVDPCEVKLHGVISVTPDKFEKRFPGYGNFLLRCIPAEEEWANVDYSTSSGSNSGREGAMSVGNGGASVKVLESKYSDLVQRRIRRQFATTRIETNMNTPS